MVAQTYVNVPNASSISCPTTAQKVATTIDCDVRDSADSNRFMGFRSPRTMLTAFARTGLPSSVRPFRSNSCYEPWLHGVCERDVFNWKIEPATQIPDPAMKRDCAVRRSADSDRFMGFRSPRTMLTAFSRTGLPSSVRPFRSNSCYEPWLHGVCERDVFNWKIEPATQIPDPAMKRDCAVRRSADSDRFMGFRSPRTMLTAFARTGLPSSVRPFRSNSCHT